MQLFIIPLLFFQLQDSLWDDMYFGAEEAPLLSDPNQPLLPDIHGNEDPFPRHEAGSGSEEDVISRGDDKEKTVHQLGTDLLPHVGGAGEEKDLGLMEGEVVGSLMLGNFNEGGMSHASLDSVGDLSMCSDGSDDRGGGEREMFEEEVSGGSVNIRKDCRGLVAIFLEIVL